MFHKRQLALFILAFSLPALAGDLERARDLYTRTDYKAALQTLEKSPEAATAAGMTLAGQSHFMQGNFKKAVEYFEKAAALDPRSSTAQLWLGRAWGRRAETSNPLQAPGFASKARQSFEAAVKLDPKNREAVGDLLAYYLEAPGFLGGGMDKAAALAERTRDADPVEYHYNMAKIAERRKQYDAAEGQLRRATEMAPKQVGRLVDLAKFLSSRGRIDESEAAFRQAEKIDAANPTLVFERANAYVQGKRNLPEAKKLLQRYLLMAVTADDPPKLDAKKLLEQLGD